MLWEQSFINKENIKAQSKTNTKAQSKAEPTLYQTTVAALQQQITLINHQRQQEERQWAQQVENLRIEIKEYKHQISNLTDKYLLQTLRREENSKPKVDYERLLRQKDVEIEHERSRTKQAELELCRQKEETLIAKKQASQLQLQKQKNMEISLLEKMNLEQRNKILEEEVESKKRMMINLKKQLQAIYQQQESLNQQERTIQQKSKQLQCYSKEINDYNRLNELKMRQQICHLNQENQFLKNYIHKLQSYAHKECDCEAKDQQYREKMYKVRRELALAKVKLSQQSSSRRKRDSSDSEESYSFQKRK